MGRLNFNQMKRIFYSLKKQLIKYIPYKYKKPIYLLSNILGLIAYFNFMKYLTHSEYLVLISNGIKTVQDLCASVNNNIFVILVIFVIIWIAIRYCIEPSDDPEKTNRSLYREINALISFAYIGITVLAFLPFITG